MIIKSERFSQQIIVDIRAYITFKLINVSTSYQAINKYWAKQAQNNENIQARIRLHIHVFL